MMEPPGWRSFSWLRITLAWFRQMANDRFGAAIA